MDFMFLRETFDTEVSKSLEKSTNLAADPAMNFDVSFVSAVLTITDEYSLNVVGSLAPVCMIRWRKNMKTEMHWAKLSKIRDLRRCTNRPIQKTHHHFEHYRRYQKITQLARLCVQLKVANREMLEIVSQLSSRTSNYHLFPSVTSQLKTKSILILMNYYFYFFSQILFEKVKVIWTVKWEISWKTTFNEVRHKIADFLYCAVLRRRSYVAMPFQLVSLHRYKKIELSGESTSLGDTYNILNSY